MKISKEGKYITIDGTDTMMLIPKDKPAIVVDDTSKDEFLCVKNFTLYGKPKGLISTLKFLLKVYKYIS